jgi:hypothetical protein
MIAFGFDEDRGRQRGFVIGADEPEGEILREGGIQQRLMPLAFDQLVRAALRKDRLADTPQPTPFPLVGDHELIPSRNDPTGIGAYISHIRKLDALRISSEFPSESIDLSRTHHNQRRLAGARSF